MGREINHLNSHNDSISPLLANRCIAKLLPLIPTQGPRNLVLVSYYMDLSEIWDRRHAYTCSLSLMANHLTWVPRLRPNPLLPLLDFSRGSPVHCANFVECDCPCFIISESLAVTSAFVSDPWHKEQRRHAGNTHPHSWFLQCFPLFHFNSSLVQKSCFAKRVEYLQRCFSASNSRTVITLEDQFSHLHRAICGNLRNPKLCSASSPRGPSTFVSLFSCFLTASSNF